MNFPTILWPIDTLHNSSFLAMQISLNSVTNGYRGYELACLKQ